MLDYLGCMLDIILTMHKIITKTHLQSYKFIGMLDIISYYAQNHHYKNIYEFTNLPLDVAQGVNIE